MPDRNKARKQTAELYEEIREKVITPLMVRRTRTDLLENERYKKDLTKQGIVFPKTTTPQPVYIKLETQLEQLYNSTIKKIDNKEQDKSGLLHARYQALHYLKPEFKEEHIKAELISKQLVAIMKTLLLKRMDSSSSAFRQTLDRFIRSSKVMLKMIENNQIIILSNIKIETYILDDKEDELMEIISNESLTNPNIIVRCRDNFKEGLIDDVKQDYKILEKLKLDWDAVTTDPKFDAFLTELPTFLDKAKNPQQKMVLFTESTDTMNYLTEQIKQTKYGIKTLSVNSQNRDKLKETIEKNFDANFKGVHSTDYQIILTTDALAEGVNLQRANTVINYDTPWNATKLMQRIGRVNRIGQIASHIFVYNFYPTKQIDHDIELQKKAIIKLQAFHSALGEDSQIYSPDEETGTFGIFDKNIKEEVNKTIPFLEEIRQFRQDKPQEYKRIKELPTKVRNAVKNTSHKNGTLIFARTQENDSSRFYMVKAKEKNTNPNNLTSNDDTKDYSFIKAARLLKCTPNIKAEKLPKQHYPQVLHALDEFKRAIEQDIVNQTQNKSLSSPEQKALNCLKGLKNMPNLDDNDKQHLNLAIEAIKNKTFQKLSRDINTSQKNIKLTAILESTIKIIKTYDVNSHIEDNPNKQQKSKNYYFTILCINC